MITKFSIRDHIKVQFIKIQTCLDGENVSWLV